MKTVAVFDDDASICEAVTRLVEKMGLVCVSAQTLVEAAFEIGKSKPEIIIADFDFKFGLNISMLAKTLENKAEKVIILSASEPEEIKAKHPELAFATFLKKGQGMTKLKRLLE